MNSDDYVLITGVTSGIGYAFAKKFSHEGFNIIGIARRHENLQAIKLRIEQQYHNNVFILAQDLSRRENIDAVFEELQSNHL